MRIDWVSSTSSPDSTSPWPWSFPFLRVSGNYVNVLPDGKTFLDVNKIHADLVAAGADGDSVENIENGRLTTGSGDYTGRRHQRRE